MNRTHLFLFFIVSTGTFSCSAMESYQETFDKQQTKYKNAITNISINLRQLINLKTEKLKQPQNTQTSWFGSDPASQAFKTAHSNVVSDAKTIRKEVNRRAIEIQRTKNIPVKESLHLQYIDTAIISIESNPSLTDDSLTIEELIQHNSLIPQIANDAVNENFSANLNSSTTQWENNFSSALTKKLSALLEQKKATEAKRLQEKEAALAGLKLKEKERQERVSELQQKQALIFEKEQKERDEQKARQQILEAQRAKLAEQNRQIQEQKDKLSQQTQLQKELAEQKKLEAERIETARIEAEQAQLTEQNKLEQEKLKAERLVKENDAKIEEKKLYEEESVLIEELNSNISEMTKKDNQRPQNSKYSFYTKAGITAVSALGIFALLCYYKNLLPETLTTKISDIFNAFTSNGYGIMIA